ncbi:hypothetical protein LJK87_49705 [Paenibacillus sp. P25]|nr:hypothetical protein LJK87_49705 [Paenibacillus sp. P25]
MLTLAPETEGAFGLIERLRELGIVSACGHTDASYETVTEAAKHGRVMPYIPSTP